MMPLLRNLADRISMYLPIVMMGLLALGTYWLVRSTPVFEAPLPSEPLRKDPDYTMKIFSVRSFDAAGKLKSEVTGQSAKHFPDSDTLEISLVRIRSFNDKGQLTLATSQRARTNSDGSEVELTGDARVVREPAPGQKPADRLSFSGEQLMAYLKAKKMRSDKPVVLRRGQDEFTAESMSLDNSARVVELRGRVRGTIVPALVP